MEDKITKHLPNYPTHGQKITIEHLLTHTSGIPSYTEIKKWRARMREDLTVESLLAVLKDKPFDFNPREVGVQQLGLHRPECPH